MSDKIEKVQEAFIKARNGKGVFGLGEKKEDDSWLDNMYGDKPESTEFIKNLNTKKDNPGLPKATGRNIVEFFDNKGNKIIVPSENYIKELESKLNRQNEISRIQAQQIEFLNGKFLKLQEEIKRLQNMLGYIGDQY